MRSGVLQHAFLALLSAVAIVVIAAAPADAAEPATYQLPDATHARSLSAAADGTVWFVPSRGSEWEDENNSIIGSLSPDGTVAEHEVAGSGTITKLVLGPTDEVWIASYRAATEKGERLLEIGRLSPSGEFATVYTVGHRGWIGPMAIGDDAIWFGYDRPSGPDTIERVSIDGGAVRHFALRPRCEATAVAVGAGGALRFAEACRRYRKGEGVGPGRGSIGRIAPDGQISRRPLLGPRDHPFSLAIGSDGTVWFGVSHWGFSAPSVGRITSAGALAEYPIPNGWPRWIAVGPEGRLWFQSSFGGWNYRALNSIGIGGRLGKPICADPTCQLEPTGLIRATSGSLCYGLTRPNLNSGGGGSGLAIGNEIANEAGLLGHLVP
jgi:virginiamycin B lyase